MWSTVGGGDSNNANDVGATIAGGRVNVAGGSAFVGGGYGNEATGDFSVVCGGGGSFSENIASGFFATIPGGRNNVASGDYSFAAGRSARAIHDGSFVWADSSTSNFSSHLADQFKVRANGGLYFAINNGQTFEFRDDATDVLTSSTGASLTVGGAWTDNSDRASKENFRNVDGEEVLEKVSQLEITEWNYKAEADEHRHLGPTAQDFHALFGLGTDDKSIATLDEAGVALAAIKELHNRNQELKAEIAELRRLVLELSNRK
jgi:hypothetical protein